MACYIKDKTTGGRKALFMRGEWLPDRGYLCPRCGEVIKQEANAVRHENRANCVAKEKKKGKEVGEACEAGETGVTGCGSGRRRRRVRELRRRWRRS